MKSETFSDFMTFLSSSSHEEYDSDVSTKTVTISSDRRNNLYGNVQIFSDHLKTSKRFQKTFYYGDLLPSNFHPPLTLTDVTLELFNKTVPNACRLDILDFDYATTVSKSVCISPYSMVLAMMYLEQLRHKNPDYLENVSPCDLYVVSILVASKYLFDNDEEFIYNYDWADAANIDIQELNRLEKEFLAAMDWCLYTKSSDFFSFLSRIEGRIAYKQSLQRDWLSYTEILTMCQNGVPGKEVLLEMSNFLVKVILAATVSYATAVSIIYGAVAVTNVAENLAKAMIKDMIHADISTSSDHGPVPLPIAEHACRDQIPAFNQNPSELSTGDACDNESVTLCKFLDRFHCNSSCNYSRWAGGGRDNSKRQLVDSNNIHRGIFEFFLPVPHFKQAERTRFSTFIDYSSILFRPESNHSMIFA